MATGKETGASEEARWIDAITRMIALTQANEIEWYFGDRSAPGAGSATTPSYYTEYRGRKYRLQGRRTEADADPYLEDVMRKSASPLWRFVMLRRDALQPREQEVITLEMVDGQGHRLYRVPGVSPLRDLLNAVQRQTADPNAAIEELLGERSESYEKPLNQMLLELSQRVPDAVYWDDNTGEKRLIENMRGELEDAPTEGPLVVAEADDRGVYSITTSEEGYSAGLVGSVYEDTGEEVLNE